MVQDAYIVYANSKYNRLSATFLYTFTSPLEFELYREHITMNYVSNTGRQNVNFLFSYDMIYLWQTRQTFTPCKRAKVSVYASGTAGS